MRFMFEALIGRKLKWIMQLNAVDVCFSLKYSAELVESFREYS
jgi:hypothetical protein